MMNTNTMIANCTSEEQFQRIRNFVRRTGAKLVENCYWIEKWQCDTGEEYVLVRDF